jgi:hypothetical protein
MAVLNAELRFPLLGRSVRPLDRADRGWQFNLTPGL